LKEKLAVSLEGVVGSFTGIANDMVGGFSNILAGGFSVVAIGFSIIVGLGAGAASFVGIAKESG
jgi:hypothetical protein